MLLTIALVGLFVLATLGSFGALLDAAVRGANAYPRLKLAVQSAGDRKARVRKIETIGLGALPARRPARSSRPIAVNRGGDRRQPVSAAA